MLISIFISVLIGRFIDKFTGVNINIVVIFRANTIKRISRL
jgi:hypothetical protein